jgi:putative ABC transport system substrate-binding protein
VISQIAHRNIAKAVGLVVCTILLSCCSWAEAQQQVKVFKIGWLFLRPAEGGYGRDTTRQAFRELGYIEGENITFEYRHADNQLNRLPILANELVRLKVDVILAASANVALAAKNATKTIPIVFLSTADPVTAGLVDSLPRPGGNLTGFTTIAAALTGKRLELLKETLPGLSRVGFLWNPKNPGASQDWKESVVSARELGLQLDSLQVTSAEKFDSAFREATRVQSKAIAVTLDGLINTHQKLIAGLAIKYRIAAIYPRGDFVETGGLFSYGTGEAEPYKRIAAMTDKILKGRRPAEIPVEQPTKFELVINLKAAKQIGLTIPPNMLARADKVRR